MFEPIAGHVALRGGGLFGPNELRRLLVAEFDRARRHGFPLACLVVGIDRLGQLHDLYGRESKLEIHRSVMRILQADRRVSDFMAVLDDDRLLVVVPHAPLEGVRSLVRRLQRGARRLRFEGESRALEITLSAGLCQGRGDDLRGLDVFVATTAEAQQRASALGGDRVVEQKPPVPEPAPSLAPAPGDESLAELALRLDASGAGPSIVAALLDLLSERHAGARDTTPAAPTAPQAPAMVGGERDDALEMLERRVSKMADLLARVERSLAAQSERSAVPGVAAPAARARADTLGALREELMGRIFDANVALRREVEKQRGAEGAAG